MAKIDMTYGQLKALRDDILFQQNKSAFFYYFNKAKTDRFDNVNQMKLTVLKTRLDEFVTRYVKMNKDGQPETETRDGQLVYCFYSDEYRDKYLKELNHFLSLTISVEL